MKQINIIMFALAVILFQSCAKKEEPQPTDETPVFMISGLFENIYQQKMAGENDEYMFTSYRQNDSALVYEFIGDMKRTCTSCKESLRIIIRNYTYKPGPFHPDSAFAPRQYTYKQDQSGTISNSYLVSFDANPQGSGTPGHLWDFGDGTFSTQASPVKEIRGSKNYVISYTASYSNGCASDISMPIKINPFIPLYDSINFIYHSDSSETLFSFSVIDSSLGGLLIWDFGDAQSATGLFVTHQYQSPGIYKVSLTHITPSNDDTTTISKNISAKLDASCKANFNYKISPVHDPFQLSTVIVEWTDADGNMYSSVDARQDQYSDFIILSSSPYILNENGQKTRALKIRFNCKVSNGSVTKTLKNMTGYIALGHP